MTIRNNNNSNDKSFASSAPTEETDAVAFNVNAVDVFNEDNIPFAHATTVSTTAANSGYGQLNSNNNASATTTTTNNLKYLKNLSGVQYVTMCLKRATPCYRRERVKKRKSKSNTTKNLYLRGKIK